MEYGLKKRDGAPFMSRGTSGWGLWVGCSADVHHVGELDPDSQGPVPGSHSAQGDLAHYLALAFLAPPLYVRGDNTTWPELCED